MAKGDDIEERLIDFAVAVIELCSGFRKTQAARHVAGQLLRSGTAPAPNYAEARAAESTKDFVHKLKIVSKELNETRVWLRICKKARMIQNTAVSDLLEECEQLCRIIGASIKTAKKMNG